MGRATSQFAIAVRRTAHRFDVSENVIRLRLIEKFGKEYKNAFQSEALAYMEIIKSPWLPLTPLIKEAAKATGHHENNIAVKIRKHLRVKTLSALTDDQIKSASDFLIGMGIPSASSTVESKQTAKVSSENCLVGLTLSVPPDKALRILAIVNE